MPSNSKRTIKIGKFFRAENDLLTDISEEGQRCLREFTEGLIAAKADYGRKYAGQTIIATVKIVCYSESRARAIGEYIQQLLAEHDREGPKVRLKFEVPPSSKAALRRQTYQMAAEITIRRRGPQPSHPTVTFFYEIIEEEDISESKEKREALSEVQLEDNE